MNTVGIVETKDDGILESNDNTIELRCDDVQDTDRPNIQLGNDSNLSENCTSQSGDLAQENSVQTEKHEKLPCDNSDDSKKSEDTKVEKKESDSCSFSEGAAASKPDMPESSESVYQIKWIYFKRNKVPIITQNENGPCPLLAIMNVLLLQDRIHLIPETEMVSANQLMAHLGDCVLQNVPGEEVMYTCPGDGDGRGVACGLKGCSVIKIMVYFSLKWSIFS